MSNSGRKMSTPGWCTFALVGCVLVVAFGAFASAGPQSKSEATLVSAAEQAGGAALIDQAGVVAVKSKAADTKQNSSLATSTGAAAGPSLTRSTAPLGVASAANLTEVQPPRGNEPTPSSGTSLSSDATRSAQGGDPACGPGTGDCCADGGNGTPGCDDEDCCNCICDCDPFCCGNEPGGIWDSLCAGLGFNPGCGASDPNGLCTAECSECLGDPDCPNGVCGDDEDCASCPADCGACPSDCTVFTDKGEFEAFNAEHGKVLKGTEDFEETAEGTEIVGFTDPLCGGIPNPPFDNGLNALNLCVQANVLGAGGDVPAPHGDNGLVFVPFGAGFGENSDIVLSNYFAESFDLMFGDPVPPDQQDNHTGVGFDAVSIFGGGFVDIEVYDKDNVLMAAAEAPATARGEFWGVWCPETIGRINIFDTGNGAQGADNIQMWLNAPNGACCDHGQPGGLCIDDLSESDCLNDPSLLQPEFFPGLTCADVEAAGLCEEHTGACCDGTTGTCLDNIPESQCPTEDPQFRWEKDTPCSQLDPPCTEHTGACCDGTTGNCDDDVPESECPVGCFGECINGGYCDDPDCCIDPDDCLCYSPNSQISIELCGDCFGECINGGYCDPPDPNCCIDPPDCVCYGPSHPVSISLCGDCFGECIDGGYCDPPDPNCCVDPGNCVCVDPSHPVSIKLCGDLPDPDNQYRWEKDTLCVDLDPPCEEHTGACCDGTTGVCTDGVPESQCPVDPTDPNNQFRWEKDVSCDELDPPCEEMPPPEHEVWDMVWSDSNVQWGPGVWTINGVPICVTFPNGVKTDEDNPHDWDHIVCPGWPNDWHWDAWFDWFGIPAHISVWFENFAGHDRVEIELHCSPKWLEYSIQVDIGNNNYTLMDVNGIPFWTAPWSGDGINGGGYPGNLPPGFDPTGDTRGNQLMCGDCPFDIDGDGLVNALDLANLLGGWGCPVPHNLVCFDVDMDNCLGAVDLANLLGNWGPCP